MNSITHLDRFITRSFNPPPTPPLASPSASSLELSLGGAGLPGSSPVASSSRSVPPSPASISSALPRRRTQSSTSSSGSPTLPVQPSPSDPLNPTSPATVKRRRGTSTKKRERGLLARFLLKLWVLIVGVALWCSGGKRGMLAFGAGGGAAGGRGRATSGSGRRRGRATGKGASHALKEKDAGNGGDTTEDNATSDELAPFPDPRTQAVDPRTQAVDPRTQVIGPSLGLQSPAAHEAPSTPTRSAASALRRAPNPTFALLPPPTPAPEPGPAPAAPPKSRLLNNPLGQTTLLHPSAVRPRSSVSSLSLSSSSTSLASSPQNAGALPPAVRKTTPFHKPKTLILDLDETLIHSTSRPMLGGAGGGGAFGKWGKGSRGRGEGHMVEVFLGGRSTVYHVYKRPFVDYFLKKVSSWYTLVIFTASMQEYADPVIDWLDGGRGMFAKRFFRDSCVQHTNGAYIKDLSCMDEDLESVALIDNSPISYQFHQANGIPIDGWFSDPADQALLDLLPVLDSLRFTGDVRHVLGLRGF